MATVKVENIGVRYGLYTAAVLVGYFLFMQMIGLGKVLELRVLNLIILLGGIILAEERYKSATSKHMEYLTGYGLGGTVTLISISIFALFIGFYLSFDHVLMETIKATALMGHYLDPYTAAFAVFGEGLSSGLIASFAMMQWYKRYTHQTE